MVTNRNTFLTKTKSGHDRVLVPPNHLFYFRLLILPEQGFPKVFFKNEKNTAKLSATTIFSRRSKEIFVFQS